jgi:hypothetical protein
MGVSGDDTGVWGRDDIGVNQISDPTQTGENTMKRTITRIAPLLAAAAVSGVLVLAPVASAAPGHPAPSPSNPTQPSSGADPDVPFGVMAPGDEVPYDPYIKNPGGGVDLAS